MAGFAGNLVLAGSDVRAQSDDLASGLHHSKVTISRADRRLGWHHWLQRWLVCLPDLVQEGLGLKVGSALDVSSIIKQKGSRKWLSN